MYWSCEVRGIVMPASAKAALVSPEQSYPYGPLPPQR